MKLFDRVFGPMLEDARSGRRYGTVKRLLESALDNYCQSCWDDLDDDSQDGLCEQCRSKGARA